MALKKVALLFAAALIWSCSSGGGGAGSSFRLIEFLESGKDSLPRNRTLTFRFSQPVEAAQDFAERLRVQNIQTGAGSNFSKALGVYLVDGERVTFVPRLPEKSDRSDAGFRSEANYAVFVKAGPDALQSEGGDPIGSQQEFLFNTASFFEDPVPNDPPRALGLVARDPTNGTVIDLSRLDPRPDVQDDLDSAALIGAGRVIDPGAGGAATNFGTPWHFELTVSEPVDPATVSTDNIEMFEIFSDATTSGDVAPPAAPSGHMGTAVSFKVPLSVRAVQIVDADGNVSVAIRVTPLFTLVDNTRYRLRFSGNILGIDFRKAFIGENGLTGDGETVVGGGTQAFVEPGGVGYTAEFIVRNRPSITSRRTVTFDPLVDNVRPESGQTATDPAKFNTALYNPTSTPSQAVGFLPDFGDGSAGPLAVGGGSTLASHTGDTPNASIGNPFTVPDLNANDEHDPTSVTPTNRTYDSPAYFEAHLASLTVSAGGTLRVIGKNPMLFRVTGIVQVNGTLDAGGADGQNGSNVNSVGGEAGAGGGDGGDSQVGGGCNPGTSACQAFSSILNSCSNLKNNGPFSKNGVGPGRGMAGGEAFGYPYDQLNTGLTGTGGGGGSHATVV